MSQVTPEQARTALANIDRHVMAGRAATMPPAPMMGIVAVTVFASFASRDLPDGWLQYAMIISPLLVLIPVLLASRVPALASAFGIHATQRENRRDAWRLDKLPKQWWLYMAPFGVLLMLNTTVADLPVVENAVRVPHTVTGVLVAVYLVTASSLWRRRIGRQAR